MTAVTPAPIEAADESGSRSQRNWALFLLFLTITINYADRGVLNILVEPIKQELKLTDLQIGALGGLSFAILHMSMAIPVAWAAERYNRVSIISAAMILWSGLTALCGAAQSFLHLVLLRIGIGMGEAGASPPGHSLISDFFPANRRSIALSIMNLGVPLGTMLGTLIGGAVAHFYGWRAAFLVLGLPGVFLALLLWFGLAEPSRGALDHKAAAQAKPVGLLKACGDIFRIRTFVLFAVASSLANLANQGIIQFNAAFYVRKFGLDLIQVGAILGTTSAVAAAFGMLLGGFLGDGMSRRDVRWYAWLPALGLLIAGPFTALAFAQSNWQGVLAFQVITGVCSMIYIGPVLGTNQNLAPIRMRATSVAMFNLINVGIGYGVGPMTVGYFGDHAAKRAFVSSGLGEFTSTCPGGVASEGASEMIRQACTAASAAGLQEALAATAVVYVVGAALFLLGGMTIRADLARARAENSAE